MFKKKSKIPFFQRELMRFKSQRDVIIIAFCRMTTVRVHFFQMITSYNITK